MEGTCKKASELKSLDQVLETQNAKEAFAGMADLEELVATIRRLDILNCYNSAVFVKENVVGFTFTGYYLAELYTGLDREQFLNDDIRLLGNLKNYFGDRHFFFNEWVNAWNEKGFNKCYEGFCSAGKISRIVEIFKKELPVSQQEIMEFDLTHWGQKYTLDHDGFPKGSCEWGLPGSPIFNMPAYRISEEDYTNLQFARRNIESNFDCREIKEIILS
ncbi:hypothetical protein IKF92_02855 [Candidatus Saccharibacteria bacterium]|nr:hypothetical protein [Candidatus Saccharibacteria bacterium]